MVKAINKTKDFLFPTQVVSGEIPEFEQIQDKLIKWIYKYKKENEGNANRSCIGGWQSTKKDVFTDEGFKEFHNVIIPIISELVKEFNLEKPADIVQMWININNKGAYNVSHRHPNCDLSGVIWIKQSEQQGNFVFDNMDIGYRDWNLLFNMNEIYRENNRMTSSWIPLYKDGTIIIFPSELSHRVDINETEEDRISLSFNIKLK